MAVPVENAHHVPRLDANIRKPAREPADPLAENPIAVTSQVAIDDFLIRRMRHRVVQQMFDEKWVLVSRRAKLDEIA